MSENQKLLIDMQMSHEIVDAMCETALANGALGAKVTGGGRGGYMLSLTPGNELQDSVAVGVRGPGLQGHPRQGCR